MKNMNTNKRRAVSLTAVIIVLAFTMIFISSFLFPVATDEYQVGNAYYSIVSENDATAMYVKPTKKSCTTATVPSTVKIGKKTYTVTKIGKKAFYGCKSLKNITIRTTKLTQKSVGSKAFAKIHPRAVVTVPKNKVKAYKEILKKAGLTKKGQKVKGETENVRDDGTTWQNYVKGQPLPEPESAGFTIGDLSKKNATIIDIDKVAEATYGYYPGSDITVAPI